MKTGGNLPKVTVKSHFASRVYAVTVLLDKDIGPWSLCAALRPKHLFQNWRETAEGNSEIAYRSGQRIGCQPAVGCGGRGAGEREEVDQRA